MGADLNDGRTGGPLPRERRRSGAEQQGAGERERLIEAMVELAGQRGFAATPVADLSTRAQVSRQTFYAHFATREDLLLSAFDTCATASLALVRFACEGSDTNKSRNGAAGQRIERLISRLCDCENERPGTTAMCTVEINASIKDGGWLRSAMMTDYGSMIQTSIEADGEAPMSDAFARALAGAVHRTIDMNLRQEDPVGSEELKHDLARWACSYRPFPSRLRLAAECASPTPPWPWLGSTGLAGGRAPGTLTLAPEGHLSSNGLAATTLEQHTSRERILDTLTQLNAEHGYPALTAETIAARAELPEEVFHTQFADKDDAFVTALDLGHTRGRAIVERARADASSWAEGARATTYALLEFLASEPEFTKLALRDAPLASSDIALRAADHIAAYAQIVFDGAHRHRAFPRIWPVACFNGLLESSYADISQGLLSGEALILSTFFVLAPVIGVRTAAEIAAGGEPAG